MENIIFEGGGVAGLCHIGILQELGQENINSVKFVAGSSAGAVVAAMVAAKVPIKDMADIAKSLDLNKHIPLVPENMTNAVENTYRLIKYFGLLSSDSLYSKFNKILKKYTFSENITFRKLYKLTRIKLTLTATNINESKTVYFDHILTPNMSIAKVVQMSISYPFVFTPVRYKNQYYVDGGILANLPINSLNIDCDKTKTLCCMLSNPHTLPIIKINNFTHYIKAVVWQTILRHARTNQHLTNPTNYPYVYVDHGLTTFERNFDIEELFERGRNAYKSYCNSIKEK